jgi:hypothetical protein
VGRLGGIGAEMCENAKKCEFRKLKIFSPFVTTKAA